MRNSARTRANDAVYSYIFSTLSDLPREKRRDAQQSLRIEAAVLNVIISAALFKTWKIIFAAAFYVHYYDNLN